MRDRSVISRRKQRAMLVLLVVLSLLGCSTTLVAPFDQKLIDGTDALYKRAAGMIDRGMLASPRTDRQRSAIAGPASHPGHFSRYRADYDALLVGADALILGAVSQDWLIDARGEALQRRVLDRLGQAQPSLCPDLQAEIDPPGLTSQRVVDLKCLLLTWRQKHDDREFTMGTRILKRANWEGRKRALFNAVLVIQQVEKAKQPKAAN